MREEITDRGTEGVWAKEKIAVGETIKTRLKGGRLRGDKLPGGIERLVGGRFCNGRFSST